MDSKLCLKKYRLKNRLYWSLKVSSDCSWSCKKLMKLRYAVCGKSATLLRKGKNLSSCEIIGILMSLLLKNIGLD
uniref:Uncharacterized protein n=1 Tax=Populus trichocarpa TaxID=3694 RepID=U5FXD7_POPTR